MDLWFGDERCVPPDHEHSNFRMAKEALLDRIEGGPTVHRMRGELGPEDGGGRLRERARARFGPEPRST